MEFLEELPEGVQSMSETNYLDMYILKWSGDMPIPPIGSTVSALSRYIRSGTVIAYVKVPRDSYIKVQVQFTDGSTAIVEGAGIVYRP